MGDDENPEGWWVIRTNLETKAVGLVHFTIHREDAQDTADEYNTAHWKANRFGQFPASYEWGVRQGRFFDRRVEELETQP